MIKIHETVREILESDEEAHHALSCGYMNLSAYAKQIEKKVEDTTKKNVGQAAIVVALSRIKKETKKSSSIIQDIKINNITTKSPLSEIVFEKTPSLLSKLSSVYEKVKTSPDDFLTMTLSTSEITVICSVRIKESVLKHFKEKPYMIQDNLASIGLSLDPRYYKLPGVTFSLIRKIAQKKIVLAETITTYTEIIFVFHEKDLPGIVSLFRV